jgi:hypothetical protein
MKKLTAEREQQIRQKAVWAYGGIGGNPIEDLLAEIDRLRIIISEKGSEPKRTLADSDLLDQLGR